MEISRLDDQMKNMMGKFTVLESRLELLKSTAAQPVGPSSIEATAPPRVAEPPRASTQHPPPVYTAPQPGLWNAVHETLKQAQASEGTPRKVPGSFRISTPSPMIKRKKQHHFQTKPEETLGHQKRRLQKRKLSPKKQTKKTLQRANMRTTSNSTACPQSQNSEDGGCHCSRMYQGAHETHKPSYIRPDGIIRPVRIGTRRQVCKD